jgi:hypothetical protein
VELGLANNTYIGILGVDRNCIGKSGHWSGNAICYPEEAQFHSTELWCSMYKAIVQEDFFDGQNNDLENSRTKDAVCFTKKFFDA